ncbi:MAG: hypothetical protein ABIK89_14190, partial [Planctomycetota bacterium]
MHRRLAKDRRRLCSFVVLLALALIVARANRARGVTPTPSELEAAKGFAAERLLSANPANVPFSFVYGGKPSAELLKAWQRSEAVEDLDPARTKRTIEYADPQTGLQVRCEAIEYHDFPTVQWTL